MVLKEIKQSASQLEEVSDISIEEGLKEVDRQYRDLTIELKDNKYNIDYDQIGILISMLSSHDDFESEKVKAELIFMLENINDNE